MYMNASAHDPTTAWALLLTVGTGMNGVLVAAAVAVVASCMVGVFATQTPPASGNDGLTLQV